MTLKDKLTNIGRICATLAVLASPSYLPGCKYLPNKKQESATLTRDGNQQGLNCWIQEPDGITGVFLEDLTDGRVIDITKHALIKRDTKTKTVSVSHYDKEQINVRIEFDTPLKPGYKLNQKHKYQLTVIDKKGDKMLAGE